MHWSLGLAHFGQRVIKELTWNKSTQLHDAFIGRARQRHDLIGCSETRSVGAQSSLSSSFNLSEVKCAIPHENV